MKRGMARAERLREMERLYTQRAFTDIEMAERLGVDRTTVYRDRLELETEIPFEQVDQGSYRIDRARYLSGIRLNLHEALTLYLAARRTSRGTRIAQPHVASALEKLAAVLRQPMTARLVQASSAVLEGSAQPERVQVLETVARAWAEGRKVRITHRGLSHARAWTYRVSPYLIEPSLWSDGAYLIGYSDVHNGLATFKIERIESAELTLENFDLPDSFDDQELLRHAWGIWYGAEEPVLIRLRFFPGPAARRLQESIWHPTQAIELLPDGGCIWSARVAEAQEMLPWIRGWGAACEVLEPETVRAQLKDETRRLAKMYAVGGSATDPQLSQLLRLWGKTRRGSNDPQDFHPAMFHMLDTAHVAKVLLSNPASPRWRKVLGATLGGDPELLTCWLPIYIALHDIGKISAAFQEQVEQQKRRLQSEGFTFGIQPWNNDPSHALISQWVIHRELIHSGAPEPLQIAMRDALGGHHGKYAPPGSLRETRLRLDREPPEWQELRRVAIDNLRSIFPCAESVPWPTPKNISSAALALTGFTILCDWLASDENWFPPHPYTDLDEYLVLSQKQAEAVVSSCGFYQQTLSGASGDFESLFPTCVPPRPLQLAISAIPASLLSRPCLVVIEAPTGEGKTEASLALAHRLAQGSGSDEFYYALPTTATSNSMFTRVQDFVQNRLSLPGRPRLVHGQAFLYEDYLNLQPKSNGGEAWHEAEEWFAPKKRALLAPFGVGTVDQTELAALNVRHTALRLYGLAGKVIIFDEVHAYDTYMTTIIERLLKWLSALGTSVILLSATLPRNRRAALARAYSGVGTPLPPEDGDYPALWVVNQEESWFDSPPASQEDRLIDLNWLHFDDEVESESKARWLLDKVQVEGCACWIANTVDRAQQIFSWVDKLAPLEVDRLLLHARFPLEDRQRLESQLMEKYGKESANRPKRGIVIGTQVLEQSLDLDFDLMVSDLAPVDLILQRVGRLHRHSRRRPYAHSQARLWINTCKNSDDSLKLGVDAIIYPALLLMRTWEALSGCTQLRLPAGYRPLVEAVYTDEEPASSHPLRQAWEDHRRKQADALEQARLRLLPAPDPQDSFCGPAARLVFEENEDRAAWIVAQTRLGQESLAVIPLERESRQAVFWTNGEKVSLPLDQAAARPMQLLLLRRGLRLSNPRILSALKADDSPLPALFTDSPLLHGCRPLWLENGSTVLVDGKASIRVRLDSRLGFVIKIEKGV